MILDRKNGKVNQAICNIIAGRLIKNFICAKQPTGKYAILWRGSNELGEQQKCRVYFLILRTDSLVITTRIQIIY
ncbi:MAG: hypothetical protein N2748_01830 [candidate division WOR-3 bacterium]|nr:hypothetical protein [candidate division WOR-3 bacterium]